MPAAAPIRFTVISVDDHLVEPPHLFDGRMPAAMADRAPYVRRTSKDHEIWVFDGHAYPQVGLNAVVGRSKDDSPMEPVRFDQIRKGCWDPDARLADMDLAGIWASVNFPSQITGFCGTVYSQCSDPGARPGLRAGLERLVPRGVVVAAPGTLRADGHHLPGRSGGRRGRDPSQRGPRLPGREPARAAAPPRLPVVALGMVGPGAVGLRRDRHRRVPARRQLGDDERAGAGTARWSRWRPRCSRRCRSPRASTGCGRSCRCASPS